MVIQLRSLLACTGALSLVLLGAACADAQDGGGQGEDGGEDGTGFGPAPLDDAQTVTEWAGASAPNVFGTALGVYAILGLDESCPTMQTSGSTTTYEGGCTDESGNVWVGRATVTETAGASVIVYDGIGFTDTLDGCEPGDTSTARFDGRVEIDGEVDGAMTFDVDLTITGEGVDEDTCLPVAGTSRIDYRGSSTPAPEHGMEADRWEGNGTLGSDLRGSVSARTDGEVIEADACAEEAIEGTTTLESDGDVVVITYDGATDCDPDSTVTWTFNGEPRGELSGISCHVSDARGRAWWMVLGLPVVVRRMRKRR